jgi:hypothetical protein
MDLHLRDRVYLVTGGGRGLGSYITGAMIPVDGGSIRAI